MKLAKFLPSAVVSFLLAWQLGCAPKTPHYTFQYAEKRAKLKSNGLRVVIMPQKNTELVEVDMRMEVGQNEDPPGQAGLAHLVEHLMFQQRPDGPTTASLWEYVMQLTTFVNAYTSWDKTHYMMTGRKENLDALLKVQAMRLFYGCKTIPEEQFKREREVVRNEIRQRDGKPEDRISQLILSAVYPKGHPYERMIGGDDQQLANITLDDVCSWVDKYYVPERAILLIAGNVEPEETTKLVTKWFGPIPAKTPGPRVKVEPVQVQKKKSEYVMDVERPSVHVAFPILPITDPDFEAAYMAAGQLVGIVNYFGEKWDFATAVNVGVLGDQLAPTLVVSAELRSDKDVGEALDFIWKATGMAYRPFESGMFDETKVLEKAQFVRGLERLMGRTGNVADLVQYDKDVDFASNQEYLIKSFQDIDKLSGGRARKVAKKLFKKDNAAVVVIKANPAGIGNAPRASLKFENDTSGHRDDPPVDPKEAKKPLVVSKELSLYDNAERYTLGNGMRVVLLPFDTLPIASAELVFDVGSAQESPSKAGLAMAAARFLRHPQTGAQVWLGRSRDAYSKTGTSFQGNADQDTTTFFTSNINLYMEPMIRGLERLITAGEYNQEGLESFQRRQKFQFKSKRYMERMALRDEVGKAVYGPNHPYATTGSPTPKSIGKLNRDDLMAFKRKHYSAKNATLVVAGSFDVDKVKGLISGSFGGWGGGHEDEPVSTEARQRTAPEFIGVVGRKDPQTLVVIAYPGPAGIDGQEGARLVMTEMIQKRVGKVRHELGASYGIYAYRSKNLGPSVYQIAGPVDTARLGEALKVMRGGLESLRVVAGGGEGVTAEMESDFDADFATARRKILAQLLGQSNVTSSVADRLAQIAEYNLSPDYYDQLLKQVAAASPALVKAMILNEFAPNKEIVALMSDRETMQKAFDENGIEQVKYVEPDIK